MHTPILIGILATFVLVSWLTAAFFFSAWRQRRPEREYLYFALVMIAVSAHALAAVAVYATAAGYEPLGVPYRVFLDLSVTPSKLALGCMFHFALRYAGVERPERYALPMYALMGAFALLAVSGHWWGEIRPPQLVDVAGIEVHHWPHRPSWPALPFYPVAVAVVVAVVYLTGRAWRARGQGLAAFVGAVLLGATSVHDLALGGGWIETIPLFGLGFVAFTYGLGLTVVARYVRAAGDLETSTEELSRRSQQLKHSLYELRHTQQRLIRSEQLAVVGELAAVIAHEVRNPLAIVGNAVASLRKRGTTRADRRTLLEIINEEMSRLDKLVSRLINYARPVRLQRSDLAAKELCERSAAVAAGVEVAIEGSDEVGLVGDAGLLRQAFENLFSNAAQAGARRIVVRVERRTIDGVAAVAVSFADDGEGMDARQLHNARSPFFTTRPTGTGLGLPIVARIVEAHGGRLELESSAGVGTTVTVIVPERPGAVLHEVALGAERISLLP
jgi:signal transduction histidine kinase